MNPASPTPASVDQYISGFPEATQDLLEQLRATIRAAAPDAEEVISYKMPAYKQQGILVYFAGYKNHIGFYPGAGGVATFKTEIDAYANSKGTVQFPLDQPLPIALITKIVLFRVMQDREKAGQKKTTTTRKK